LLAPPADAATIDFAGTDITLYQLGRSYRDLDREYHVKPLTIAAGRPVAGTAVKVVSSSMKKVFSCAFDQLVHRVLETGNVTKDVLRTPRIAGPAMARPAPR
jgi:hypothetical protein